MILDRVFPRWPECTVIVAATGPFLTPEVAELCGRSRLRTIVVNDAWRLMPWADILYACDGPWWDKHKGCPDFGGEKWSSHEEGGTNDKRLWGERYGLTLVPGRACEPKPFVCTCDGNTFSCYPSHIHYGGNSGFQAINLALLFGARRILLVGFNMDNSGHFFGAHPKPLRNTDHSRHVGLFRYAAQNLPPNVAILNATPHSALVGFPRVDLEQALLVEA